MTDYRAARTLVGLVPQELTTDAFESVWGTVSFSRGLFGKRPSPAHIERVLKDLAGVSSEEIHKLYEQGVLVRDKTLPN